MGLQLRMKRQADEIIPLLKASSYRCKGAPLYDEEVASTLRLLEIVGCADIPVSIIKKKIPTHSGWSRTTVSCAAISHLPFTFLSTIRMRPSTVIPALVAW